MLATIHMSNGNEQFVVVAMLYSMWYVQYTTMSFFVAVWDRGVDIMQQLCAEHPLPIGEDNFLVFLTERLKEDIGQETE